MQTPIEERFWSKVQLSDSCWLWTGSDLHNGYGAFHIQRGTPKKYAHRFAWELFTGQHVPAGKCILHRCDVRICVNPDHLFLGDKFLNNLDTRIKRRNPHLGLVDHCLHGHRFTPENTRFRTCRQYVVRACRTCDALHEQNRLKGGSHDRTKSKAARLKEIYG